MLNVADAKDYITFGLRSSGSQILFFFYTNVDYPIVGHYFGDTALGLYRLAYEVVLEPVRMISNVVVDIAFPAFARLRNSSEKLLAQYVAFSRLNLVTVMSYAAVVFVAAPDVIHVLFPHYLGAQRAARILCAVAVLRSLGFVTPPLLDGVGRPDRTFTYMICAAITLPCAYITGALVLGPSLGFESVAIAWAIGYPVAFVVLVYMATQTLGWSALDYAKRVGGVVLCLFAAGALAAAGRYALGSAAPAVRLLVTVAIVVVTSGLLLAYTQNMTLRGAMRSMRDPVTPDQPT
jgi:O-antigen/teichoic acid export membrane protein